MVKKLKQALATASQAFPYWFSGKISAEPVGTREVGPAPQRQRKDGQPTTEEATWQRDP
jgi:hypothetical protein